MIDIQQLAEECRQLAEQGARWNLGELELFAWSLRSDNEEQLKRLIETLKTRTK